MKIVIDANIIFSALIRTNPIYLEILQNVDCYALDILLLEIDKYREKILKKTTSVQKSREFTYKVFENISIIPKFALKKSTIKKSL